jgi:hypothetical protein
MTAEVVRPSALVVAVGVCLIFACSCASISDQINQGLARFDGEPLQAAIDQFGRPDRVVPDGMGGKIVSWSWIKGDEALYVRMWADTTDTIVKWQWRYRDESPQTYYWYWYSD